MEGTLRPGAPDEVGVCPQRLETVYRLIEGAIAAGEIPGAAICVARRGVIVAHRGFGRRGPSADAPRVQRDTIFLVASITKPVVCTAVMKLVERGQVLLDDPVARYVPEFAAAGKEEVRVRHLLTHTSGLPDMLPDNRALREAHTPLPGFLRRIYETPLDFPSGTGVQYQSTGTATLGEIVARVAGAPLPVFLHEALFRPLGMTATALGLRPGMETTLAECRLPEEHVGTDWGWNSDYWRTFGAPWGGMFSTVRDIVAFGQMFLQGGRYGDATILGAATVAAMTRNQLDAFPDLADAVRRRHDWGLGWRLAGNTNDHSFAELLSPRAFGHAGATGCVAWFDPDLDLACALFTNEPLDHCGRFLRRCGNAVAASVIGESQKTV
jgi:CubicO group peptidase (beta-lactamase class C family)